MRWFRLALIVAACVLPASLSDVKAAFQPAALSCTSRVAINQTASTDVLTLTNHAWVCGIILVSATAQNVSITQGTGTTCATSAVALIGGTTASMAIAANGGLAFDSGTPIRLTTTTGQHLCVLQSGSGNVSGIISYVDSP